MTRPCICGHALADGHAHAIVRYLYGDGSEVMVGPYYSRRLAQAAIDAHPSDEDLIAAEILIAEGRERVAS